MEYPDFEKRLLPPMSPLEIFISHNWCPWLPPLFLRTTALFPRRPAPKGAPNWRQRWILVLRACRVSSDPYWMLRKQQTEKAKRLQLMSLFSLLQSSQNKTNILKKRKGTCVWVNPDLYILPFGSVQCNHKWHPKILGQHALTLIVEKRNTFLILLL